MTVATIPEQQRFVCVECEHTWSSRDRYHWWPIQVRFKWRNRDVWYPEWKPRAWGIEVQSTNHGVKRFRRVVWFWRFSLRFGPRPLGWLPPEKELHCPRCKVSFWGRERVA
jgi:hypothetical protein